jgi:hypothetical protein
MLGWFLFCAARAPWPEEAKAQVATARSLIARGSLDIASEEPSPFTHVSHGRRYAVAPPGVALTLLGPEALRAVLKSPRATQLAESATSALALALLAALFAAELRRRGLGGGITVAATLGLVLATGLCASGRALDGSALEALLLYVAVVQARRPGSRSALKAGLALAALVLVEPALAPAGVVLVIGASIGPTHRRSINSVLALALPFAVGVALVLVHRAHTGHPPAPRGDVWQGLDGLLLSTGKCLFLYSPVIALVVVAVPGWWRARRDEAALSLAVVAAVVVAVAALDRWHGDPAWGPRRITPILPLLAEPVAWWVATHRTRAARVIAALLLGAGLLVQGLGAALSPETFPRVVTAVRLGTGAGGWFVDPPSELHFIPQFSPITGHAFLLSHWARKRPLDVDPPWHLLLPSSPKLEAERASLKIDWWVLDAPRPVAAAGLVISLLLVGAGLTLTIRRLRMLR